MLGLDPRIHATGEGVSWDVDPRVKPEDDAESRVRPVAVS
jgi:hypothetical protein